MLETQPAGTRYTGRPAVKTLASNIAPRRVSQVRPRGKSSISIVPVFRLAALVLSGVACLAAEAAILPQSDQDALFNQAVQAYQQNQFKAAQAQFQQVTGAHAPEAQAYIGKIKTYLDAWSAATTVLQRNSDEQDARSLAYAIEELQIAISIKPDGPGHPDQQIAKARQLKQEIEQAHSNKNKDADRSLCDRALAAATEHHFKEASELSCLLAEDDPGYSCGGNEAVYICHLNTELAKMDKGGNGPPDRPSQKPSATPPSGDSKPTAEDYLDKISRYTVAVANGEKLALDGKYEEARSAFLTAASIKPNGPGNPQNRASTMELFQGLDQFYSGDYVSATQHLESCAKADTTKQPLIHFYLGASKLARFFVTGAEDASLHQDALNDLKLAKQAGFKATGQDVSPKILEAYKGL
jgi:tetratricopeptide (TPR) repeat protein